MNDPVQEIYLVDDDAAVLQGLARLLRAAGYKALTFTSPKAFMEQYQPDAPGCLVLDVSMPEITGLELQEWLVRTRSPLPIVFLTGRGDIPSSVRAMKLGAVDFLTKPVAKQDLLKALQEASRRAAQARVARLEEKQIKAKLATLTPRERQVLAHVVSGQLNKQIAAELGTVEKTIKFHRANVMAKMGAQSLAELVRITERAGIGAIGFSSARPGESVTNSEARTAREGSGT